MKIHALFVTYTDEKTTPQLADAWDEYCVDSNRDGFEEAKKKAAADDEVHAFAELVFEVSEQAVLDALYPDPVALHADVVED